MFLSKLQGKCVGRIIRRLRGSSKRKSESQWFADKPGYEHVDLALASDTIFCMPFIDAMGGES